MDREGFIHTLVEQYRDDLKESYLESEHDNGVVEYEHLNKMIEDYWKAAKLDGLPLNEYCEILQGLFPEHLESLPFWKEFSKKSA